jgi:hypothetical protein
MAEMSAADTKFVADMTAHMADATATAKAYLATNPAQRRANLSEMARETMTKMGADMAKMRAMGGSKGM